jgi:hypothetical protein
MSSIKEQYQIGKIMKLIDLNKDVTNFELNFQVVAEDDAEFEVVIVDQATLDEGNLDYRKVQGAINGNIRNDKNVYQNYMMALRADTPCNVNVETTFDQLPDNIPQPGLPPSIPSPPPVEEKKSEISWKYIILGIVVVVGAILLYYFYMYGGGSVDDGITKTNDSFVPTVFEPSAVSAPIIDTGTSEIFTKLRNLPLR